MDIHPHLGLLSLGTVARRHGHEVVLYDPKRDIRSGRLAYDETVYDRVAEEVLSAEPDVVGLTTLGASLLFAAQVARRLKDKSNVRILMGGPHATMLHRQIMESYPAVDAILRHEAEDTLPAVLDRLKSWEFHDVPGVTWRTRRGVEESPGAPSVADLDTLPLPDYDLYPAGGRARVFSESKRAAAVHLPAPFVRRRASSSAGIRDAAGELPWGEWENCRVNWA